MHEASSRMELFIGTGENSGYDWQRHGPAVCKWLLPVSIIFISSDLCCGYHVASHCWPWGVSVQCGHPSEPVLWMYKWAFNHCCQHPVCVAILKGPQSESSQIVVIEQTEHVSLVNICKEKKKKSRIPEILQPVQVLFHASVRCHQVSSHTLWLSHSSWILYALCRILT